MLLFATGIIWSHNGRQSRQALRCPR